jgi:hypothetical protein
MDDKPSGIRLADFPVGSARSRAAARMIFLHRTRLSENDEDALCLYGGDVWLHYGMSPGPSELEMSTAYARGREIYEQQHGPPVLAHLDPALQRCTAASIAFERVFQREPKKGDVLRYQDVERHAVETGALIFERFIEAWQRRIPELTCPLKLRNGRLFQRIAMPGEEAEWQENREHTPEHRWRDVEACCADGELPKAEEMPTIRAVVFLGVVNGTHRCVPQTLS